MEQASRMRKRGQINVVLKKPSEKEALLSHQEETDILSDPEHSAYRQIQYELDEFIGLSSIKQFMKEIYAWLYLNQKRQEQGLKTGKQVLHMVFKGNPGTGKTTVARLIAKLFKDMGVLEKGHLIEAERADLVGEYIGHTAQKTRDLVQKALGGILFVDEAYSLSRGGEKDFGKEAIDTLVKAMEDQQHSFVLILAGYPKEMDRFLSLNPGLPSRFPMKVTFPNYTVKELTEMANKMVKERDYKLDERADKTLAELLKYTKEKQEEHFSNGRFIRNLLERAIRAQAVRLLEEGKYDKDDLITIRGVDLSHAFKYTEDA
ncbi:stage V sporulation protein K [Evansella cellulosilytica]|uniref:Stage V sporulation protein K n=1 Tax=Evansella cellulosilytica (strain ATCC 21833 / DSM 2522 / FERM P-1141 / JCM 9156 / N-4) TaxID=649639 RepID=E6TS14_EVAC2|nr:stage V sporulation protein K [Evansella cellulosilytica]ADU30668.1 stage V sporulation protein K [Evansella cellulosilytica DSM 2522]